jgi:ATP-dependent Clp protease ATP-binding subunit ClpA
MFERFTDRARRVLVLAQEEATLRQHGYLGTEHILVGLLLEGGEVVDAALHDVGVKSDALRDAVIARMGPPDKTRGAPPFTPKAKRALEMSLAEALKLGHNYIGPEHLLLGLCNEGSGVAAEVLQQQGATIADLRRAVARLATPPAAQSRQAPAAPAAPSANNFTPAADTALRAAKSRATPRPIGTHDRLAAILFSDRSASVTALRDGGFDIDALRRCVESAATLNTSDQTPEETVASQLAVRIEGERVVISVENDTIVAALREQLSDPASLSAENPQVAHHLGTLWQQIHDTLRTALDRLGNDAPAPPEEPPAQASE